MAKDYRFIRNWAHLYERVEYGEDGWKAKRERSVRYDYARARRAFTYKAEYVPMDFLPYSSPSDAVICLTQDPT